MTLVSIYYKNREKLENKNKQNRQAMTEANSKQNKKNYINVCNKIETLFFKYKTSFPQHFPINVSD